MALIRDPGFWRRFSLAVHRDEEAKGAADNREQEQSIYSYVPVSLMRLNSVLANRSQTCVDQTPATEEKKNHYLWFPDRRHYLRGRSCRGGRSLVVWDAPLVARGREGAFIGPTILMVQPNMHNITGFNMTEIDESNGWTNSHPRPYPPLAAKIRPSIYNSEMPADHPESNLAKHRTGLLVFEWRLLGVHTCIVNLVMWLDI